MKKIYPSLERLDRLHEVKDVTVLPGFWLRLVFDEGEVRYLDVKNTRQFPDSPYYILKDEIFETVHITEHRALEWDNGADMCADYVWLESITEYEFMKDEH